MKMRATPAPPVAEPIITLQAPADNRSPRRQIRSDDLFGGSREVLIEHAGELYSLRQTSKGKLILTK